jgi:hypothetical protein
VLDMKMRIDVYKLLFHKPHRPKKNFGHSSEDGGMVLKFTKTVRE